MSATLTKALVVAGWLHPSPEWNKYLSAGYAVFDKGCLITPSDTKRDRLRPLDYPKFA